MAKVLKNRPKVIVSIKGLVIKKLGKNLRNRPIIRNININVKKGEILKPGLAYWIKVSESEGNKIDYVGKK